MIEVKNLLKTYNGKVILKDVNLTIEKGDRVVLIGESGCGKSTLLRCINGLNTFDSGEIIFDGKNIHSPDVNINDVRKRIGMVYQQFNLFSHLNVMENIMMPQIKVLKKSKKEAAEKAKQLLDTVGMSERMFHMPSELSGGQKQRVAIARTLAMDPEVILFDEPTSALDPTMVDEVECVIKNLAKSGMTCVIVTHEMSFAKNIATQVVFLAEKGIYEKGTDELITNPGKSLTRMFLYRSRMLQLNISPNNFNEGLFYNEICNFMSGYSYETNQKIMINAIIDEIIYPIFDKAGSEQIEMEVRFIASATSTNHVMFISIPGLKDSPLDNYYVDEVNMALLEHYGAMVVSKINGDENQELCIWL